jgi:pyruvate,water dikinase
MESGQSLWEIAQAASRSPEVRELMLGSDLSTALDALAHVEGGAQFRSAFEGFLQRYGWRSEGWEVASPTWREQPAIPLGIVRRMIIDETPSPAGALDDVVRRRRELADDLESRLQPDSAKQAEFRDLLAQASSYVSVREDRAHWQLTVFGSLRAAVLRRGEKIAQAGLIDRPEDIFYLLPEEIERQNAASPSRLRSVVEDRRREWERWSGVEPPNQIGVIDEATTAEAASEDKREIRGVAASQGVVTGPAKVVSDIADGDKLLPGDILVCRTTSPPWTVLFGRAAAVVTDTGGALAHTAITAREYAIPCVVGARGATDRIHDGKLITVNGTEGVVLLTV